MKAVVRAAHVLLVVASWTVPGVVVIAGQSTQASRFDRVQYLGGMVGFRGTSSRWDNTLTISPKLIAMRNNDSVVLFEIRPSQIKSVQYLQYGRANLYALPFSTVALLVPKASRIGDHFIAIEYFFADCQLGGLLLRAHKNNYRDVFTALTLTHKAVEVEHDTSTLHPCLHKPDKTQSSSDSQRTDPADSR